MNEHVPHFAIKHERLTNEECKKLIRRAMSKGIQFGILSHGADTKGP